MREIEKVKIPRKYLKSLKEVTFRHSKAMKIKVANIVPMKNQLFVNFKESAIAADRRKSELT